MPPRPHPVILVALAVACFVVAFLVAPRRALPDGWEGAAPSAEAPAAAAPHPAAAPHAAPGPAAVHAAAWRWPLRGAVVGRFRLTPNAPFARGQRRGIDVAAASGTPVHAACGGRVSFAGALPHQGFAVTVRCGALVATYLHLGRLAVRRGARASTGQRLGTLGPSGSLRLGARRAGDRRGYVDPLALLRDPRPTVPPTLGPAPHPRRPRPLPTPPARPRAIPAPAPPAKPRHLPWPAYPAVALIATALPLGSLVHHRRRRHHATTAAAAHEGP